MFLEHNSKIVLEILNNIMLCKHNVSEAYFILGQIAVCNDNFQKGNRVRLTNVTHCVRHRRPDAIRSTVTLPEIIN